MQNCLCFLKNGKTTIVTETADSIYWSLVVLVLAGPACRLEVLVGAVPEASCHGRPPRVGPAFSWSYRCTWWPEELRRHRRRSCPSQGTLP